jgi:flagellar basal-body rod protein FlgG
LKDLWVPISGAIAQQKNVETIANNVANANTPGFKKDQLAFKEHLQVLEKGYNDIDLPNKEWAPADFYRSYGAENAQVKVDGSYTNHQQGSLQPTNNPLDLGIHGKGFFEVLTPNGVRYTRKGTFSINSKNQLVTSDGFPVLSKLDIPESALNRELASNKEIKLPQPEERIINLDKGNISINLEGEIYQSGNRTGKLAIVEFEDIHAIKKEGNSFYINNDIRNIKNSELKSAVHQGFVEGSNVNAVSEMSNLIKAHRHFESIQKVIKAYDEVTGRGVNEIAKF